MRLFLENEMKSKLQLIAKQSVFLRILKYARAVKQKVWNEAENARETLTPRFTNFFTDFEKKKNDCFAVFIAERISAPVPFSGICV